VRSKSVKARIRFNKLRHQARTSDTGGYLIFSNRMRSVLRVWWKPAPSARSDRPFAQYLKGDYAAGLMFVCKVRTRQPERDLTQRDLSDEETCRSFFVRAPVRGPSRSSVTRCT
jgi:hypothetical protein